MVFTCTGCRCGCNIKVDEETGAVNGYGCGFGMSQGQKQLEALKAAQAQKEEA